MKEMNASVEILSLLGENKLMILKSLRPKYTVNYVKKDQKVVNPF